MKHVLIFVAVLCIVVTQTTLAQTWVSLNGPQIASDVKDISLTTDGGSVFIADASYVVKSTNSGTAWKPSVVTCSSPLLVLVKPDDASKAVAAKAGELRYSNQGGDGGSWDAKITDPNLVPLRLVAAVNDASKMLLARTRPTTGDPKAIWRSVVGGATWFEENDFTPVTNIYDFTVYPNNTSGHAPGIVWAAGLSNASPPASFNPTAPAEIRGLWISTNYGDTWPNNKLGGFSVVSAAIVSRNYPTDYHVYAAVSVSDKDTLKKLTDHANNNWTSIFYGTDEIRMVRVNVSTTSIFLATNDGVYRSTDAYGTNGGGTWSKLTNLPENDVKSIAIGSGSTVFAGTTNSLYKSTDNGSTWKNVGIMNVSSVDGSGTSVWAVSRNNAYAGKYNGSTWTNAYVSSAGAAFSSEHIYRNPYKTGFLLPEPSTMLPRCFVLQMEG